jgi:hypothetical protein
VTLDLLVLWVDRIEATGEPGLDQVTEDPGTNAVGFFTGAENGDAFGSEEFV